MGVLRFGHGIDLSKFHHVEEGASGKLGDFDFTYEYRYVGTEPYDVWDLRRLLGEGFEIFMRDVRTKHSKLYIGFQ